MANFMRTLVATILGVIIAFSFLIIFPLSVIIIQAASQTDNVVTVEDNSVFNLKLSGEIVDHTVKSKWANLAMFQKTKKTGISDILAAIDVAENNPKIKGIVLSIGDLSASYGSMEEIRDALVHFKESGKFLITYSNLYEQSSYYLASCADKIFLNPVGMVSIKGLSVQKMFLKDLFDKLDLKMQIAKVGTYKSYVEQYSREDISPESRSQDLLWMNDMWNHIADQIVLSRNIKRSQLEKFTKTISAWEDPELYVKNGLIDSLVYQDQINDIINKLSGSGGRETQVLFLSDLCELVKEGNASMDNIAVLYAQGEIGAVSGGISSNKVIKQMEMLREDDRIKAVVFRVNSPGGSAFESEEIWREIQLLREKKPVVVSMGDVAASGGYYVACGADAIVAHNTTITGSIGIFGLFPSVGGLARKIGVSFDEVKTHEYADAPNLVNGLSPIELKMLQKNVERGYQLFTKRCYSGRNMAPDNLEIIAQGRVWSGFQAQKLKLVDAIGGIPLAIELAAKKANIPSDNVVNYPNKEQAITNLIKTLTGQDDEDILAAIGLKILGKDAGSYFEIIKDVKNKNGTNTIQARLPYVMSLK